MPFLNSLKVQKLLKCHTIFKFGTVSKFLIHVISFSVNICFVVKSKLYILYGDTVVQLVVQLVSCTALTR